MLDLFAMSGPLSSRAHVRPLNEDDADKRKDEAGEFHVRPVFWPEPAVVNPRMGALCSAHYPVHLGSQPHERLTTEDREAQREQSIGIVEIRARELRDSA